MKVIVAKTALGEAVDVWCVDQSAKLLRHLGKTDIVEEEDNNIGRTFRWLIFQD